MKALAGAMLAALAAVVLFLAAPVRAADRVYVDERGRTRVRHDDTEARFLNPWPADEEDAFWDRANYTIKRHADTAYGGTWFESEKRSYPTAMLDFLAGNRRKAVEFLQQPDGDAKHTLGVDLFPCFTLKGQMRKLFFFGPYLSPAYQRVMARAVGEWSRSDPRTRPHPIYGRGRGGDGWTADARGYCVDRRTTDNLRAMSEVATYLFAEASGNRRIRDLYKDKIKRYVWALYHIGMGEWDSENYHGHTVSAYVNLYDFARDPEMKLVGKAAMDWLCAAGAVKYWRGGFGGPSKRDYNKPVVFEGSAADHLHLYFGDHPNERWTAWDDWETNWDHHRTPHADQVHFITSAYRPPMAVVALARKQFQKHAELLVSHPTYETWKQDESGRHTPEFHETQYFGHSYQLGTLARGSRDDVNGFKLLAYNSERGVDYFVAANTSNPRHICAAGDVTGSNGVAQYRNLVIWLNTPGRAPFLFLLPKSADIETEKNVLFIRLEKTWLALHSIHLASRGVDEDLTRQINHQHNRDGTVRTDRATGQNVPLWPHEQILSAAGTGDTPCGFALEVGESETHGDFDAFKASVLKKSSVNLSQLDRGRVLFTGSTGDQVAIEHTGQGLPTVWRGGKQHDWKDHWALYRPADGGTAPVALGWKQGRLRVEAGGHVFEGVFDSKTRTYSFTNTPLPAERPAEEPAGEAPDAPASDG